MHEDLLSIADVDAAALEELAVRAQDLAAHWRARTMPQTLADARVGSIAELPGWRNPTALALGAQAMGATCVSVTAGLEGSESVEDLAGYLDNWFDLLAVRTPSLDKLRAFADASHAPVINLRTHDNHPVEVLGDLAYVWSRRSSWDGLRVAMVGPKGNIANSWLEAATVLPIDVVHVAPPGMAVEAVPAETPVEVTNDIDAVTEADVIVTDCWPPSASEAERSELALLRIDAALLDRCRPDALFIPCPPVSRGQEVTDDACRIASCVATEAKAFLLHVQNAWMQNAWMEQTL